MLHPAACVRTWVQTHDWRQALETHLRICIPQERGREIEVWRILNDAAKVTFTPALDRSASSDPNRDG